MARYPQGLSVYIPSYQAYQPDLTTMGKMLSIKQNQYDQNWKKLNNIYSSLYFSETSHEQSQAVKDQLKNEIDFNLRRVSGLDLSLDQNIQAAQQVFQPFYQNKSLMYDMAATKNFNTARNRGMGYKNSVDPKEQKMYWNDGIKELDYRLKEFKETPYDQIQSTGLAQVGYTPYVDIGSMFESISKELGDKTITTTSNDGRYQIETTNGPALLMQPLADLYQLRLANDPRVQDMYKTQAYVDRKDWSFSHAGEYGGDVQAAERAYLENEYRVLQGGIRKTNNKLEGNEKSLGEMQNLLQNALDNGTASPETEKVLRDVLTNKELTTALLNSSNVEKDMVSEGSSNGNTSTGSQVIFQGDIDVLRNRVDFLRANSLMKQDFTKAAYVYSQRNMKTKVTEDQYALAAYKDQLKAKSDRKLAMDKYLVESGTAVWSITKDGIEAVPVKARNNWQSEGPAAGVTAGETNLREFSEGQLKSEWQQVKPGLTQGIDIASSIGIERAPGPYEKIYTTLKRSKYVDQDGNPVDKNNRPLTLGLVKEALANSQTASQFEEETGLDLGDVYTLNSELLDLMTNDETTATLVNDKFQTQADKQKIINWRKEAIKDNILLKGIGAERKWLKQSTDRILKKAEQSSGPLKSIKYAVDSETGTLLGEKEYYDNALKAIEEQGSGFSADWIRKYLADNRRYANIEKQLDRSIEDKWKKGEYLGASADYLKSVFNTYKDTEDFLLPEEAVGELFKYFNIDDYDDVKEAYDEEWSNSSNFKEPPPSSFGTGTGISSLPSSTIVTPGNQGARPTQDFYGHGSKVGIYSDYMNVKNLANVGGELSVESPVIFSGVGTTNMALDGDVNTSEHQSIAKRIWEAHADRNLYKKGEGFKVVVKPTTEISGNKAAYTIFPTKELIDDLIPTGSGEEEKAIYQKMKQDFMINGATVISDRDQFDSYAFEASTTNPIEAALKSTARESNNNVVTESYNIEPGYGMDFTLNSSTGNYSVNHRFKAFDLETYLSTGKLMESSVPLSLVNGETLYTQFESFQTTTMPTTKAANAERVNLIRALRQRNPNITDAQIRQIFATYNFQYNL